MTARLNELKRICRQFPVQTYESIDNNRLAVYTIRLLQVNRIPVTQEAATVALFLMFPRKFSLVGFEEYPDAERVHRTLLQLGPKWRNWATGSTQTGYSLNRTGEAVFEQVDQALKNPSSTHAAIRRRAPKLPRTRDPEQEIKEIEGTSLFRDYISGKRDNFSEFAIWELLKSYPYAPKEALRNRFDNMVEYAKLAGRSDVIEFLKWVRKEFSQVFS